jgi:hypothetical protein
MKFVAAVGQRSHRLDPGFDGEVRLFQADEFHASRRRSRDDITDLRGTWSDKISSIRVL